MHHESLLSSWVYWIIFFVFLVLVNNSDNSRKRGVSESVCFYLIFLFAALRYGIGNDFMTYWEDGEVGNSTRNYELLSGAIIDFAYRIHFPPFIFIAFAAISLVGYRSVIKTESTNPPLSWYMYFTYPLFFFQDCSSVRQAGAMGLFFLAYSYLGKDKQIKAVLCLLLSVLFHTSAVIGFLILFRPLIKRIDVRLSIVMIILSVFAGRVIESIVMGFFGNTFLGEKFEYYLQGDNPGFNTMQYVIYGILLLNIIFYKRLIEDNENNKLLINLYTLGVILYHSFSIEPITAIRFSTFFFMFEILLIPSFKNVIARMFQSKPLANGLITVLMFSLQLTIIYIYIRAYNSGIMERPVYVPYETWINHI